MIKGSHIIIIANSESDPYEVTKYPTKLFPKPAVGEPWGRG